MSSSKDRRSPRVATELPIRVYGTDYQGTDFVEDSLTSVISNHGAKIRLVRSLMPEQEIRIFCSNTQQDAVFRVISSTPSAEGAFNFWGVEYRTGPENIWGIELPNSSPNDQRSVRVMVQCPECRARELLYFDERLVEAMQEMGGLLRGCMVCRKSGWWKQVPYADA